MVAAHGTADSASIHGSSAPVHMDTSGHTRFAPLTAKQTLEMIVDGKEDSISLHKSICALQQEIAAAMGAIAELQREDKKVMAAVSVLQAGLATSDKSIQQLCREVERHDTSIRDNRASIDEVDAKVKQVLDVLKLMDHQIETRQRDGADMRAQLLVVQADLAKNFEADKSDRSELDGIKGRLFRDMDKLKYGLEGLQDTQRDMEASMSRAADEVDKTVMNVDSLEARVKDSITRLWTCERSLADNAHSTKMLADDHERTKYRIGEVDLAARDLNQRREDLEHKLDKAILDIKSTQGKVISAQDVLEDHNQRLYLAQDTATAASQGNIGSANHIHQLKVKLEGTHDLATAMKDGLRQTNLVTLPNLLADAEYSGGLLKHVDIHPDLRPPMPASGAVGTPRGWRSRPSTAFGSRRLQPSRLTPDPGNLDAEAYM